MNGQQQWDHSDHTAGGCKGALFGSWATPTGKMMVINQRLINNPND